MTRTRQSAKNAGTAFETMIARHLDRFVGPGVERRAKTGAKDRGDLTGLRHMGARIVVECKNHTRIDLAGWASQAEIERGNDDAAIGLVIHKRHGNNQPGDQWVTMTLNNLIGLITGFNPDDEQEKEAQP